MHEPRTSRCTGWFQRGRGTRDQIANICWIIEKAREFQENPLLTRPKPLTVWITTNCGTFFKRWEYQTTWPASWESGNSGWLYFWGSKITADGDCSHELKRCILLGRTVMTNVDSILKSRDTTLPTKVHLIKAMVFPVVMYGYESWTWRKLSTEELMLLNCGVGEDSWESLGLQGDPTSPS